MTVNGNSESSVFRALSHALSEEVSSILLSLEEASIDKWALWNQFFVQLTCLRHLDAFLLVLTGSGGIADELFFDFYILGRLDYS